MAIESMLGIVFPLLLRAGAQFFPMSSEIKEASGNLIVPEVSSVVRIMLFFF